MAPKAVTNPAKLASILTYFHNSGVAHSIKDLEKTLPSVASINGIIVKDYLQELHDENQIHIEKIGSGNWYWSFPSEEKRTKEAVLEKARDECKKTNVTVLELKKKVADAQSSRQEEEKGEALGRVESLQKLASLEHSLQGMRTELTTYAENDPVEIEKKFKETCELKQRASKWMDHVQEMEKWLKQTAGIELEVLNDLKREIYEHEYDEEENALKEY